MPDASNPPTELVVHGSPETLSLAQLELRAAERRAELTRSLERLESAVEAALPTTALVEEVERHPYKMVGFALLFGMALGAL